MKKLLLIGLSAMPLWAHAQYTNSTYSKSTISNMFYTNRITLRPGTNVAIGTNAFNDFTIHAIATNSSGTIEELGSMSITQKWIIDLPDAEYTNILTVAIPVTGIYTVNFSEFTLVTNNAIDSWSVIKVYWTDPDISSNRVSGILNTDYNSYGAWTHYPPATFNCKVGTSLVISNHSLDSFDGADPATTNFTRFSVWGRRY